MKKAFSINGIFSNGTYKVLYLLIISASFGILIATVEIFIYILLGLVFLFVLIKKPYWILLLFLALIPSETLLKEYSSQIMKILGLLILLRYSLDFILQKKWNTKKIPISLMFFLVICVSSLLWSLDRKNSFTWLITYISLSIISIILILVIDCKNKLYGLQYALLVGTIPVFLSGVVYLAKNYGTSSALFLSGFLNNYNQYFTVFLFSLPGLFLLMKSKKIMIKGVSIAYGTIFGITALYTNSRGGIISFAVFLVIILVLNRMKIKVLFLVFGICALIFLFSPDSLWLRFLTIGNDPYVDRFMDIWPVAINTFLRSPIIGFGLGANQIITRDALSYLSVQIESPHNAFFSIVMDLGILGLIPFTIFIFSPFFVVLKDFFSPKPSLIENPVVKGLGIVLLALTFAMYLNAFKGGGLETSKLFWVSISNLVIFHRVSKSKKLSIMSQI